MPASLRTFPVPHSAKKYVATNLLSHTVKEYIALPGGAVRPGRFQRRAAQARPSPVEALPAVGVKVLVNRARQQLGVARACAADEPARPPSLRCGLGRDNSFLRAGEGGDPAAFELS